MMWSKKLLSWLREYTERYSLFILNRLERKINGRCPYLNKRALSPFLLLFGLMAFSPINGLKKYTLTNGLTVYLKKDSRTPVVSIQLWIKAGSLDEAGDNNGVSHFLEHMLFKGTVNYPVGEISRIVESYGGIINAGTSKEFTEYYIDISTVGCIDALKIIADIAQNASFPEDELEKERMVILEEIKRADDSPGTTLYETFNKQIFTVTPYRWRILGTTSSVTNLTRDKILNYYRRLYVPNNMVLVIIGDIDLKHTKRLVKENFSYLKPGSKNIRKNLTEPVKKPSIKKIKKAVQQDYLMCGFLGPDIDSPDQYAGDILSTLLGSGLSSRLYRRIREEKQLVYSIGCGFYTQQGSGIFVISSVCSTEKTDLVVKEISYELDRILNERIDKSEIERTKEIIQSNWYFEQETCHGQASIIGYWALLDRLHYLKKYISNIKKINEQDLKKFIKTYRTGLTTTVVYPEAHELP